VCLSFVRNRRKITWSAKKKYRENPRTEKHLHSSHIPDHAQVGMVDLYNLYRNLTSFNK
jgi:hypothetical protein